jgi:hypothetical protein
MVVGILWQFSFRRYQGSLGRMQSCENMKQIGLAMHCFAAANNSTFPPAYSAAKDGKPLLSWRVLILPYMEHASLYKEFRLDEPWDSEHNRKLISKMPNEYRSPIGELSEGGRTAYLTVRGKKTVFPGNPGLAFRDVMDGTPDTIMTVEVSDERAVIWTRPDDFEYDDQHPLKGLRLGADYRVITDKAKGLAHQENAFLAGMADGSVQFLPASIDAKTLNALFTRNGGKRVDIGR